jgi:hypothetical protein
VCALLLHTHTTCRYDYVVRHQSIDYLNYPVIKSILDSGRKVVLYIEFWSANKTAVCASIAAGAYDSVLTPFAQQLAADGREVTLMTMQHPNGDWFCWWLKQRWWHKQCC